MNVCPRCGKPNPAEIHTCTPVSVIMREAYLRGLADSAEGVSRWISVSDQKPELDQLLLLYANAIHKLSKPHTRIVVGSYTAEGFKFDGMPFVASFDKEVSHWMPLPKPPT